MKGGDDNMPKPRETFKNKITSDEITAKFNPENQKLVNKYLKNLATKRSPQTVKGYTSDFNIFFTWNYLYNDNALFTEMKKLDMQDFFDFGITELGWKSNRYARCHSALSELSKFIEKFFDDEYPNFRNLLKFVDKLPKENSREKSVFKKEELDHLMDELGKIGKVNEQCLLALIMASGARVSELVRFTTDMIDYDNTAFDGIFLETTSKLKVKGRGVDGKYIERYIIKDLFVPYYEKYLPIRKEIMEKNGKDHNFIFVKKNGDPAVTETIRSWMEKWDKYLDKHWYPHSGRHFWTSYLSSIGLEKELIQELQSWSSSELVDVYNDNTAKDKKWKSLGKLKDALAQETKESE